MQISAIYHKAEPHLWKWLLESAYILLLAIGLGFLATAVSGKGLFRPSSHPSGYSGREEEASMQSLTFEEAREIFLQGGALFMDARHFTEYYSGHIKDAVNLPLAQFGTTHPALARVSMDRLIITYCNGTSCSSSASLARKLREAGYTNVKVFFGGWNEWVKNKQPIEP